MIISDRYKYLFVELPRTASTAIAGELRTNYAGYGILQKHSTYEEFLRIASPEQKKYFVFSCIRHPMDDVVSVYFKVKNDHRSLYTDPIKVGSRDPLLRLLGDRRFRFLRKTNADFPTFFLKFYKIPYNRWTELSHHRFNFIIRYENLQEDFSKVLQLLNIPQKRELPVANKTARDRDFFSYYTPDTTARAKRVFGPFMQKWGYEFPREWGQITVPWWNELEFRFFNVLRKIYWRSRYHWDAHLAHRARN